MQEIFSYASKAWSELQPFRSDRARCKRYVYGDQWDDVVFYKGKTMTEREVLHAEGREPLKNNLLRRILRNVVGLYRSEYKVPVVSKAESGLSGPRLRQENQRRRQWFAKNRMEELSPRLLEEFLISGLVAVKVEDDRIFPVTPENFFFHSDGYDPLGRDVDLIGEVHHVSLGNLMENFCHTASDYHRISAIYHTNRNANAPCRVTEVWHKQTEVYGFLHDEKNASLSLAKMDKIIGGLANDSLIDENVKKVRSVVRHQWRRMWFAADGSLLGEGEAADMHPYVFKAYPVNSNSKVRQRI